MNQEAQQEVPEGAKFPDLTDEQKVILQQIANTPSYHTSVGFSWALAFKEHPEWEKILLTDQGRPISHLWHMSRALKNGTIPGRPFPLKKSSRGPYKKRRVEVEVVGRGPYKKHKSGGWWVRKGLPHPASAEARRLKVQRVDEVSEFVRKLPTTSVPATTFCQHCGAHRSHFGNQA